MIRHTTRVTPRVAFAAFANVLAILGIPEPVSAQGRVTSDHLEARLRAAERLANTARARILKSRGKTRSTRTPYLDQLSLFEDLREQFRGLDRFVSELSDGLRRRLRALTSKFRGYERDHEAFRERLLDLQERYRESEDLVLLVDKVRARISSLLKNGDDRSPGEMSSEVRELESAVNRVTRGTQKLRLALIRVSQLDEKIGDRPFALRAEVEEFREREAQERKERHASVRLEKVKSRRMSTLREALVALAAAEGLPRLDRIDPYYAPSARKGEFAIRIEFEDDRAEPAARASSIELTEKYLERVPFLISGAFNAEKTLERVYLAIRGTVRDSSGIEFDDEAQSFVVSRQAWSRLVADADDTDWEEILSKSAPAPAFPRATRRSTFLTVIVPLLCGLALLATVGVRALKFLLGE